MSIGKVLVIEDDRLILRSICEALHDAGYDTVAASNVAGGKQQARWARPDLILLDIGLPDGNGLDILQTLAEMGAMIPVLVLTGLDPEEVKMPALRSGVQHFLKKPVRKPALLHAVAKLVARADAQREWSPRGGGDFIWESNQSFGDHRR